MSESAAFKLPPDGWRKPGDVDKIPVSYWADPLDGLPGAVLTAAEIRLYCELFGMIRPFDEMCLRPASYDLQAGYAIEDDELRPITADAPLIIGQGQIVKVVPAEAVLIPHYLIARFGLWVKQIQRGLLMGVGPQVDPGYQGTLVCPVHNPTRADIVIGPGSFARIDFIRTGQFAAESRDELRKIATEEELYAKAHSAGDSGLLGAGGLPVRLFNKDTARWRDPATEYPALGS